MRNRNRNARPARTADDVRAGAVLVLLTKAQRETLRAAAAREGLGVGPWLRSLGMRAAGNDNPNPQRA